jgi:hypothetical protein
MRVKRGTLDATRDGTRLYVLLDTDPTGDPSQSANDALTSELRAHLATMREQLENERQAHAEARRLLAAALERIPALESPHDPDTPDDPGPSTQELKKQRWPQNRARGGAGCSAASRGDLPVIGVRTDNR